MKERLVEDWLTRINERGYQAAFGQVLAAQGYEILRIGHSPYEHGKDVLAIAPNRDVHCYQLKDGDISLKQLERDYAQTCALVQTRPAHPSLPKDYVYRPFLVTNGLFRDPALDRILKHNDEWQRLGFPRLETHDGRWLHRNLTDLSSDFWPTSPPDVRIFRTLYLVDGRGDFDLETFAQFAHLQLTGDLTITDLERRAAAVNVFSSYILAEYYRQGDHWSVFRGWTITAASIAGASERGHFKSDLIQASFNVARDAAHEALGALARECRDEMAFKPRRLEWDEYTRLRNAVTIGAWAAWCLLNPINSDDGQACVVMIMKFIREGRLGFWGESCLPFLCAMSWLLESHGDCQEANNLLIGWLSILVTRQHRRSKDALPDAYKSPEDALKEEAEALLSSEPKRPKAASSHSLLPLVLLLVNRGCREELSKIWTRLSHVTITVFRPDEPAGYLDWSCRKGLEADQSFHQPQSWSELIQLASNPPVKNLPHALQSDTVFKLMFFLTFAHRQAWSIIGSLDSGFRSNLQS